MNSHADLTWRTVTERKFYALLAEHQRYKKALEQIANDPDSLLLRAKQLAREALAGDAE